MKLLSVTEYAKILHVSRQAVLKKIATNTLDKGVSAQKVGSTWIVIVK